MKVVILCGGLGTRLAEETQTRPKPMVEIGGKPILWYIMKQYSQFGFHEFVLPLGYKAEVIKEYFLNYRASSGDLTVELGSGVTQFVHPCVEDWTIQMYDTGNDTLTGGRLKRLESQLRPYGTFMLTYGDGVADVNISELLEFHKTHGKIATVTGVRPPARFGSMVFEGEKVVSFNEKSQTDAGWINGGFFVFEPEIFDHIDNDTTMLERSPIEQLVKEGELMVYKHHGFWQCMDTLRDKNYLEGLCTGGDFPWLSTNSNVVINKKETSLV